MKKILKRFWYLLPVAISIIALAVTMVSVVSAQTETVISNTLTGTADVNPVGPGGSAVALTWSIDNVTFTADPLPLTFTNGEVKYVWVKAVNNFGADIPRVLYRATLNAAIIEVKYLGPDGTTYYPLGVESAGNYYFGPHEGFLMTTAGWAAGVTTKLRVTALAVGSTAVTVKTVQLPTP